MKYKKNRYKYKRGHLLNAIVIDKVNDKPVGRGAYHNIKHTDHHIEHFMFAMKRLFPNAVHVNFYHSITRQFLFQKRYEKLTSFVTQPTQDNAMNYKRQRKERLFNNSFSIAGYDYQLNELLFEQY